MNHLFDNNQMWSSGCHFIQRVDNSSYICNPFEFCTREHFVLKHFLFLQYLQISYPMQSRLNKILLFILTFSGHLSHSGDVLLCVGVRCRASSVNILFSSTNGPILTKFGMQHLQDKETRNCKYHDSPLQGEVFLGVKIVEFVYFFKL